MIHVGDVVEATRRGGRDKRGLPLAVPLEGRVYRVTSIYEMGYGLGCTLAGMDPAPYRGYLLFVVDGAQTKRFRPPPGWYFRKAVADPGFAELMNVVRNGGHIRNIECL